MSPRKVGFVQKLPAHVLVEFCPFCATPIPEDGEHECSAAGVTLAVTYCPLCGQQIVGDHECPEELA